MADSPSLSTGFTSQSIQNTLHQVATSLPTPRKQNIACDACRNRKVKCHQRVGQEKCSHCQTKGYPCTFFVQQATSEKKRGTGSTRRRGSSISSDQVQTSLLAAPTTPATPTTPRLPATFNHPSHPVGTSGHQSHSLSTRVSDDQNNIMQLILYLLTPEDPSQMPTYLSNGGYRGYRHTGHEKNYVSWGEIGRKLEDQVFRTEFALDLVEVYFQICHTRMPLLSPDEFRNDLRKCIPSNLLAQLTMPVSFLQAPQIHSADPDRTVHPALLAIVLAWGAKFSEHPILVQDRTENGGRSCIAQTLLSKSREVAEAEKVHRVATPDHIVTALLMEPLQSQNPNDPDGTRHFWVSCAIRHLFDLQINHRSSKDNFVNGELKGTLRLAWWIAVLGDAYCAAFFRKKCVIEDEDYNIDVLDEEQTEAHHAGNMNGTSSAQSQYHSWMMAAHAMARCARLMARQLWRPVTEAEGIPAEQVYHIAKLLDNWRDEYLTRVGVPSNFQAEWDFVAAVSACSSDAQFHVLWVVLYNAIDEFGIREFNDATRSGQSPSRLVNYAQIEAVKNRVSDEALRGALRIAGLAGVLTSNGYLRLDPNVLHFAIYAAGVLLARLGRPEVRACVAGLQQYGYAYEEAFSQAAEIEQLFNENGSGLLPDTQFVDPFTHS
ncbi:hypothetical protein SISSUDRAFT_1116876 [Sistotremastrum suecicum HHB10207 ss-3]|uniref:Zn(2)-C6 fungal-type domain-containing protein n=1 Tax=Sistotremastrum suecicum HHB10207 ss-3 TaxID=1314776 RepID=A0A166HEE4_9AGAM|nr:hypothetical protein SISSUDRAFT_1116876 [Sistotremastrum suecicum HHB10207 ss-3]